ncbi:MAG: hypothetical protein V4506_01085 [Bacteroidota bacterium]
MKNTCCLILGIVFLTACKHKTSFNDLSEVSYSRDISPIISSNCAFSGCHGTTENRKFDLTTYEGLLRGGVEAGSPEKSKVYTSLKSSGGDRMPQTPYDQLNEGQILRIYVWIGQGAKNN